MGDYMNIWRSEATKWRRNSNEKFNDFFLTYLGLFDSKLYENYNDESYQASPGYNRYQIVWLKNIDMLMSSLPLDFDISQYCLYDLGCGAGISTIYFSLFYGFHKIIGIDYDPNLINKANENLRIITNKHELEFNVLFENKDIMDLNFKSEERILLYLYNSIEIELFIKFLDKNLEFFKKNATCLFYNNDLNFNNYSSLLGDSKCIRNDEYSQTVILFK